MDLKNTIKRKGIAIGSVVAGSGLANAQYNYDGINNLSEFITDMVVLLPALIPLIVVAIIIAVVVAFGDSIKKLIGKVFKI